MDDTINDNRDDDEFIVNEVHRQKIDSDEMKNHVYPAAQFTSIQRDPIELMKKKIH